MENYTVEQFHEDVTKEAITLRIHAMPEELARLDAHLLQPNKHAKCIYGLMTGFCQSKRASELIFASCPRYFKNPGIERRFERTGFDGVKDQVNGEKIEGVNNAEELDAHREDILVHFSAIETYILLPGSKNANLIAYLKGETDTLEL